MDLNKKQGKAKVNKPLAERRRRARINDALLQLKSIVLQSIRKENAVMSKLEKADILEMTVEYIHNMHALQGNQAMEPQYTTGFSECTAHVADYISNVGVNGEGVPSEDISTRLLEHLVTVTTSKDLQSRNKRQTLVADFDRTSEQGAQDCKSDDSEHIFTDMGDKITDKPDVGHFSGANEVVNSTVTMNSSGTVLVPKKRKVLADYSNLANMQDRNEYAKRPTDRAPHFGGFRLKVRSPSKCLIGKESRCVPKPIKKRLAALVSKPVDTTSTQSRNSAVTDGCNVSDSGSNVTGCRAIADSCKLTESSSNITGRAIADSCKLTERGSFVTGSTAIADGCSISENNSIQRTENPDSFRGLHATESSIRELEYTNQFEQTNYTDLLSNGSLCYAETNMHTIQPLEWSGFENHENQMSVQTENDLSQVNALHQSMYERYEEKTNSQMHFTYDSVPSTAVTDSDNGYLFYQHYFANNNQENVWRPW